MGCDPLGINVTVLCLRALETTSVRWEHIIQVFAAASYKAWSVFNGIVHQTKYENASATQEYTLLLKTGLVRVRNRESKTPENTIFPFLILQCLTSISWFNRHSELTNCET